VDLYGQRRRPLPPLTQRPLNHVVQDGANGVVSGAVPRSPQGWEQESDQGWEQGPRAQLRENAAARPCRLRTSSSRRKGRHQPDPSLPTTGVRGRAAVTLSP
jgi:hypothetical protein